VSGHPIGLIFKGQDCFAFEDGIDRLSRSDGNYQSTLCNIPEERRAQQLASFALYVSVHPDVSLRNATLKLRI
jgi:hypothetical protein